MSTTAIDLAQSRERAASVLPLRYPFAGLVLLIVAINILAGWISKGGEATGLLLLPWVVTVACMVACFAIIGLLPVSYEGQPAIVDWRAVLVDQRNKMSLSRLQLVLWSLLVISAIVSEGVTNAVWGLSNPLALKIPNELCILLGLSTASFVAAPIVLESKASSNSLDTKRQGEHAWRDIFYGDDKGNADQVDFSKVQQFFLTVVLITVYAIALGSILTSTAPSAETPLTFPPLDESFIGIMSVSQLAYIGYKALPQGKTDAPSS